MTKEKQKKKEEEKSTKEDKEGKIKELTDLAKRVQADFENYKKRAEKEQEDFVALGKVLVIKRLLTFFDSFDEAMKDEKNAEILEPLYNQLKAILDDFGLRSMKVIGEKFDPYLHECVEEECSEKPKGIIIQEIQKGYNINDFIIRHAKVKISKGKEEKKENDNIKGDP